MSGLDNSATFTATQTPATFPDCGTTIDLDLSLPDMPAMCESATIEITPSVTGLDGATFTATPTPATFPDCGTTIALDLSLPSIAGCTEVNIDVSGELKVASTSIPITATFTPDTQDGKCDGTLDFTIDAGTSICSEIKVTASDNVTIDSPLTGSLSLTATANGCELEIELTGDLGINTTSC